MSPVVEAGVHTPGLMPRHADRVLPVHELIVVQSGILPITEDDRRFEVGRGEWVLLRARHHHRGHRDLDRETWFHWVCFGDDPADPHEVGAAPILLGPRTGVIARPGRVRSLLENLLEDQTAGFLGRPTARAYLQLLLAEIQLPRAAASAFGDHVAGRAAAFIADHLTDPDLSTARIAGALAFNADYLGRAFRDAFGETPTEHIHRLRIDRARMLFRSTTLPIERVAAEVGFGDDRYFRRIFKRRVGITPGQFQRLRPPAEPS